MATTADVVVVGGGVIGASTAFHLASLGVRRIVVCERRWVAAGASGKSGALVRMHYTNEPEARLAHASLPYFHRWGELVGSGDCGFLHCGMVRLVAPENEAKLRANVDLLERIGVNTSVVGPRELRELAPGWRVDDVLAAAYEPDSGCADPVATTHGFLDRARELGAEIRLHTEVTAIETAAGRVSGVATNGGPISAPTVVVAGGAWAIPLLRSAGIDVALQPIRVQVALFRRPPALAAIHPICIDGIVNMWFRPEGPGWGSTLAGVANRYRSLDDPDRLDEGVDAEYVPQARAGLARRIPALADAPMRGGWAGAITLTEDGKPIIDKHPEIDGLFFFTGDSGSSFKTAPAIGRILAEWITAGQPSLLDPRPFRASRFAEGQPLVGEHDYGDRDYDTTRARGVMLG
jgi:sarcosine oxidase subunit beta